MTADHPTSFDYAYAKLGRQGLGNLLFPWARAVVVSQTTGADQLAERWTKLRIGPYLRGDHDKRRYHKLFQPPSIRDRIRRELILGSATLWNEQGDRLRRGSGRDVLVVEGMGDFFVPLTPARLLIRARLAEKARTPPTGADVDVPYVAMHIRLGDFAPEVSPSSGAARNARTPLEWFAAAAVRIASAGTQRRILVCSDGTDEELAAVTKLPFVERSRATNALDDLHVLAQSEYIVGSGSTFSAWGAFLGDIQLYVTDFANHYMAGDSRVVEVRNWLEIDRLESDSR